MNAYRINKIVKRRYHKAATLILESFVDKTK